MREVTERCALVFLKRPGPFFFKRVPPVVQALRFETFEFELSQKSPCFVPNPVLFQRASRGRLGSRRSLETRATGHQWHD